MISPIRPALAGWGARAIGVVIAIIIWCGTGPAAMAAGYIDYLYVEANEGDSSGGHVAIRFGDETFHFQHESPGILRVRRQDVAAFHHIYAMLGNRTIHESRIAVSDDTYSLLRSAFVRLLVIQDAQAERRDALHRDSALFESLLRQRRQPAAGSGEIALPVSGLGYFDWPGAAAGNKGAGGAAFSPALAGLRDRIVAAYGESFLAERAARAGAAIRGLELRAASGPVAISRDSYPVFEPTLSTRYDDAIHAVLAIKLLQAAPPLKKDAVWTPDDPLFRLQPDEAAFLKKFAEQLTGDLVRLAASPRDDWGAPFMLGMARLAAIENSLASGRLVLLDIFNPKVKLQANHDAALRRYLPAMDRDMREAFLRKRASFFAGETVREADYAMLERSGNLLLDVDRAMATRSPLSAIPKETFPSRPATVGVPPPGNPRQAALERELSAARAAERQYGAALTRLYGYDLFRRNCVTEVFTVINGALAPDPPAATASPAGDPEAQVRAASEARLGGFVDATKGLDFIPFISAGVVANSYAVVDGRDYPSYREARLAEMKEHEAALKVFLRESNTITSSVYHRGPGDSAFLFFTNDNVPLRPLFGVFNLLVGVGQSVAGVVTMPVTGPERFLSGTRGVLFSLPELVFMNFRKGSNAYVERAAERGSAVEMPAGDGVQTAHGR